MPWSRSVEGEGMVPTRDGSRLAYVDGITFAKPVFKGAGQVSPFISTRRRRGSSGHVKKGVRSVCADPGGIRCYETCVNHLFDRGPTPVLSEIFQHRIEEMCKKDKIFDFTIAFTPDLELSSGDLRSVDLVPLPLF